MILSEKKNKKIRSYEERSLALNFHYKSPTIYRYFKDNLDINLPSLSSLHRWQLIKNIQPVFNNTVTENLNKIVSNWDVEMRQAVLLFDEINIRRELTYDEVTDEIVGFVDSGDSINKETGKYVFVFMVPGLFSDLKFIISFFATDKPINRKVLAVKVKLNLYYCCENGLKSEV